MGSSFADAPTCKFRSYDRLPILTESHTSQPVEYSGAHIVADHFLSAEEEHRVGERSHPDNLHIGRVNVIGAM
jgi:hypothetical protein